MYCLLPYFISKVTLWARWHKLGAFVHLNTMILKQTIYLDNIVLPKIYDTSQNSLFLIGTFRAGTDGCFRPLLCTLFRLNWAKQMPGIMRFFCI